MKKKAWKSIAYAALVFVLSAGVFVSCDWDKYSSDSSSSSSCPSGGLSLSSYSYGGYTYNINSSSSCSTGCARAYTYYNNYYCWTGSTCYCYH